MNELVTLTGSNRIVINGIEIETKEYKGQRVITAYDIAKLHKREPKRVIENFQNNRGKFELGKDYFEISKDEIRKSKFSTAFSKYSNNP